MCMRYFAVTCRHGHHGAKQYEPITFAIVAEDLLEACDKARQMPGVKHDQPVLACKEISRLHYYELRQTSAYQRCNFK